MGPDEFECPVCYAVSFDEDAHNNHVEHCSQTQED